MKIIYIPVAKKIKEKNLKNYIKCFLYDVYIILRNFSLNKKVTKNTSGYIESAIYSNAKIFEAPYGFCIFFSRILNVIFDGIFINWKFTNYREDENIDTKLIKLSEKFNIKKVIVDSRDSGVLKIKDKIIDSFDYVIKREKNIITSNKKYITTMLPCTLVDYEVSKKKEFINWNNVGKLKPNEKPEYDIFFSGKGTSKNRIELIELLKKEKYKFYGGLENSIMPYKQYLETIYSSSINLALEGKGEFTFRHLEIIANCSFMICENSINQIELPLPIKDGQHFVSFKDKEDLLDKLNFYLKNEKLRKDIALKGRKVLEKYYSPKKHGDEILNKIFYK